MQDPTYNRDEINACVELAKAKAEIERLTAALRAILDDNVSGYNGAADIARRALEQTSRDDFSPENDPFPDDEQLESKP